MNPRYSIATLSVAMLLLAGCHVESHKNGQNDNVDISTPFGSMHVKTNDNVSNTSIGLTQYPGSVPAHDNDSDKDKDAADVNMNFGNFHLSVKAASFQTQDPQSKVLAFYRNDLKRYGDVIQCDGNTPVGKPDRTSQGLTCNDDNKSNHVHTHSGSGLELRTGSPQRQHIVSVESRDGGTRIGLVALELPGDFNFHNNKDPE